MTEPTARGFPSPFDASIPASCDGWQEMYPYHALFGDDRREFEEGRFWFQVVVHCPEPMSAARSRARAQRRQPATERATLLQAGET